MQPPSPDDQPTIRTGPPNGSRPAPVGWQAPSVEEMQALLPQYEIMEILGRGGMGAVYKGRQKSLKRLVAIKILPLGMADDEMKFAERFQNEAQTMAAMNHPAIVSVYDFGETPDGLLYFIMEFVDGTDVHKMIQASGKLSGDYALAITAHVCDALSYAHKRGVIHRDIKPANILIDQEGHIKVADFGLAKMHDPAQTSGLTKTNMAMGTPDYVAPEVLVTGMVADHRADIYAVGVMLYQMLTGEVPRGMFKLPSQKGIGADVRFDAIICKAMEQDREERYQSAMEVRHALDVIITTPQPKDDGAGVVPATWERGSVTRSGRTSSPSPSQIVESEPAGRRPALPGKHARAWLTIGGIAAALGVTGFLIFSGNPKMDSSEASSVALGSLPKTPPPIKVLEKQKPTATATSELSKGKEIDLLALVDVKRDTVAGEWSQDGGDLLVKASKPDTKGTSRLHLPYQPPEEYDFEIEFTPESGANSVYQLLSAYQRSFSWFMDGKTNAGSKAGFDSIDGIGGSSRTDGTTMRAKFLTNGQRHRSIVEVRRNRVRALLDGEPLVTWGSSPKSYERLDISKNEKLRDALHLGLAAYDRGVRFHKATVREITGTGKVDSGVSQSSALTSPALPGSWIDRLGTMTWAAPWSMKNGTVAATTSLALQNLGSVTDGAIRIRARVAEDATATMLKSPVLQPSMRSTTVRPGWRGSYLFQAYMPGRATTLVYMEREDKKVAAEMPPVYLWKEKPLPSELVGKKEIEWEFRAIGDELSIWADGKLVASVHDSRLTSGGSKLQAYPGFEITRLETSGFTPDKTAEAKPDVLTSITTWRDVTAEACEKAKTIPGLAVNENGIQKQGEGADPRLLLTPPGQRDQAVRVRYTGGYMQVDLHFGDGGFIYVMAQPNQTIFHSQSRGSSAPPVKLIPNKLHPPGYDPKQPHDLLVTLEGTRLRAWLDGHLVGEAKADTFTEGATGLTITPNTVVHKVELAVLTANQTAAPAAQWQTIFTKPEDFGGDLRDVEFRDGATFLKSRSHLAPATSSGGAIRATLRFFGSDRTGSLTLRSTEKVAYGEEDFACTAFLSPSGGVVMKVRDRTTGSPDLKRHDFNLSPTLKPEETFVFELRATDGKISVSVNGREIGSVPDTWTKGERRFGITPSTTEMTEFRDVAVKPESPWTDWLGPKLAAGDFAANGWVRSSNGVTTEREISGIRLLPPGTKNAAARVTYVLRDSEGLMLNARERMDGKVRLGYCAIDKVTLLHLNRLKPDGRSAALQHVILPVEADRMAERTLELRMIGNQITATLNGTFAGTATDDTLSEGEWTLVFLKGVLVKKVEVQPLDAVTEFRDVAVLLANSPQAQPAQTFNGHRYQLVSGNFNWQEAKAEAEKRGGHLAVITSAEENDWAWKTFSSQLPPQPKENRWKRGWWLGASQTVAEKPWSWLTDEPLSYECWGIKEPSASISPPRYLWMADANKAEGSSNWSAQNAWIRGGLLMEWDTTGG